MPTEAFETLLAPYTKLMRANMDLVSKFATSPEVMSQTLAATQKLADPGRDPAANLFTSNAFSDFLLGFVKNWMEFLTDLGQSTLSLMDQGQEAFLKRAPAMAGDAARAVTEMAQVKPSRTRPAAA
jgi:hypothetical protein